MPSERDTIFGGRVVLHQPARGTGYRVNADALLLADFTGPSRGVVFDLGAGVGAVALVLIGRGFAPRAVLIDDDPDACVLAQKNVLANDANATVTCEDVVDAARARRGQASVVVCNPPYFAPAASRAGRNAKARIGEVDRFVHAARAVLGKRGRACFIYPAAEMVRLFATFRAQGLEPKRLRLVHATVSSPARVVLVEARASKPGGLITLAPLIERDGGRYTPETAKALGL